MWRLTPNGKGLYILTLDSTEGSEKIWLNEEELTALKQYLNLLDLSVNPDDLPL